MPIYEFYCPDNKKVYSFYARSIAQGQKTPKCPDNPTYKMVRVMSTFAPITGGSQPEKTGESHEAHAGDPGEHPPTDPRSAQEDAAMDAVMREMEHDMAAMDENNPDPKLLAKMMRKMSDMTGEKIEGSMEEVVRKLEEGTDPEKLEEQLGGLEDEGGQGGGMGGMGGGYSRDPNLYDYD